MTDTPKSNPFIDPRDLKPPTLADGTPVSINFGKRLRMKKSRLGRNYNGKHRD